MTQTTVKKTRSIVLLGAAVAGAVTISNSLTNTQNVSADEKTPAAQEATQQNQQTDAKTEAQTKVDNAETTYNQAKEQTDTTKNASDATQAKVDEATKNQQTAQTNADKTKAQVDQAQKAKDKATPDKINQAQQAVADQQEQNKKNEQQITDQQQTVKQAQNKVNQTNVTVQNAQKAENDQNQIVQSNQQAVDQAQAIVNGTDAKAAEQKLSEAKDQQVQDEQAANDAIAKNEANQAAVNAAINSQASIAAEKAKIDQEAKDALAKANQDQKVTDAQSEVVQTAQTKLQAANDALNRNSIASIISLIDSISRSLDPESGISIGSYATNNGSYIVRSNGDNADITGTINGIAFKVHSDLSGKDIKGMINGVSYLDAVNSTLELRKNIEAATDELNKQTAQLTILQNKSNTSKLAFQNAKAKVDVVSEALDNANSDLKAKNSALSESKLNITTTNKQLELSKTAVSDAQKIVDSLNADISQKLANLNNAKKLLVDSKVEASKLHSLTEGRKAILESDERALEEAKNLLDADKAKLAEGVATLQNLQIKLDELNDADTSLAQAQADHDKAVTELVKAEKALNDAKVPNDKAQKAYQDALKIEKDAKQKLDDAQSALNKIIAHEQAEEAIKNAEAEKAKQQAQIAAQGYYTNNKGQHINAKGQLVNDEVPYDSTTVANRLNANYGNLDSYRLTENNQGQAQLIASGWHATGASNSDRYRYMIVFDNTLGREIARQKLVPQVRSDVQRAYPNINNSLYSGFNVTIDIPNSSINHSLSLIARYSNDPNNGEGARVDYWFNPLALNEGNQAYLDGLSSNGDTLSVTGWHATNQAAGRPYHYIIAWDQNLGHEIARQKVTAVSRPDVANAYSTVANAVNSGFNVSFNLTPQFFNDNIQFISRWTDDAAGNGNAVDYWFKPMNRTNRANLDSVTLSNGQVKVAGWHATDLSQLEPNHYLIVFDNTTGQQVASEKVDLQSSSDVKKVYSDIDTADHSRFNYTFNALHLIPEHHYSLVSRYSADANGNGNDGAHTDSWLNMGTFQQSAHYIDNVTLNRRHMTVQGWLANDNSMVKPYAYAILLQNGREIGRQRLNLSERDDVAKVYPQIYRSQYSGFSAGFDLPTFSTKGLQLVLRFTDDPVGNGNSSDTWINL